MGRKESTKNGVLVLTDSREDLVGEAFYYKPVRLCSSVGVGSFLSFHIFNTAFTQTEADMVFDSYFLWPPSVLVLNQTETLTVCLDCRLISSGIKYSASWTTYLQRLKKQWGFMSAGSTLLQYILIFFFSNII